MHIICLNTGLLKNNPDWSRCERIMFRSHRHLLFIVEMVIHLFTVKISVRFNNDFSGTNSSEFSDFAMENVKLEITKIAIF